MPLGAAAAAANTAVDGFAGGWVQLHVGDPGAAGTTNIASVATRSSLTWAASSGGVKAITNQPLYAAWAGTSQTLTHVSIWDASTSGNFKFSTALSTATAVAPGGSFTLTALSMTLGPLAA